MKVFIGCVKKKKLGTLKARELYNSTLFKYELAYALTLTDEENIYILSAKYGLITLDDIITNYDLTLNKLNEHSKKVWSYKVIKKAEKLGITKEEKIVFLCGNNYSKYLKKYFKNYSDPTQGLSLGNTLKFYKEKLK